MISHVAWGEYQESSMHKRKLSILLCLNSDHIPPVRKSRNWFPQGHILRQGCSSNVFPSTSFLLHILKHTPASLVLSISATIAAFWEWMGDRHDVRCSVLDTKSSRKDISPVLGWKHLTPYSHEERGKFWFLDPLIKSLFPFIKASPNGLINFWRPYLLMLLYRRLDFNT